jgi:tRNA(Ile)-lysidine synthetase-like protein
MDIHSVWFSNEKHWFDKNPVFDQFISDTFRDQIDLEWNLSNKPLREMIEHILLYDQFTRHMQRCDAKIEPEQYSSKAITITKFILDNKLDDTLIPEERCFMLLPLRHTFEKKNLEFVLDKIKEYRNIKDHSIYKRFHKATLISLSSIYTKEVTLRRPSIYDINEEIKGGLYYYGDEFLTPQEYGFKRTEIEKIVYSFLKKYLGDHKQVVISLSGGVDSMILSYILKMYEKVFSYKTIAVHIDYANRESSALEAEFVVRWCSNLKINCYVRRIDEIKRGRDKDRDMYEKVTRSIRFDMYKRFSGSPDKHASEAAQTKSVGGSPDRRFDAPVFLGHNYDDTEENIFANIKKGINYDNLRGMSPTHVEEKVIIWRPFLEVKKSDIIEYSRVRGIPYTKDSTPKWSERGKIRDHLMPFLTKFDPQIINGLICLVDDMTDMYAILKKDILDPFKECIVYEEKRFTLVVTGKEDHGYRFWKDILVHACSKCGLPIPSSKSIKSLVEKLERRGYQTMPLTKNIKVKYTEECLEVG